MTDPDAHPPKRKRRLLAWLLVVLGVLFVGAGAAYWNAQRVAKETIARHRAKFALEVDALAAKPRGRDAVLEPAETGLAEAVRERFLEALAAIPGAEHARVRSRRYEVPEPDELEEEVRVLDAHPEVVAALEPLLRVPSRPTLPPVSLTDEGPLRVEEMQRGRSWLFAAPRLAVSRGDGAEGLRLALLGCVLGADYARIGPVVAWIVGSGIEDDSLQFVRELLAAGPLAPVEVQSLARVVDRLELSRATLADALDFQRAAFRGSMSALDDDHLANVGWRHFWSYGVFLAASLDAWDGAADRLREIAIEARSNPEKAREEAKRRCS